MGRRDIGRARALHQVRGWDAVRPVLSLHVLKSSEVGSLRSAPAWVLLTSRHRLRPPRSSDPVPQAVLLSDGKATGAIISWYDAGVRPNAVQLEEAVAAVAAESAIAHSCSTVTMPEETAKQDDE